MTSSTVRRILLGVAACALMGCAGTTGVDFTTPLVEGDASPAAVVAEPKAGAVAEDAGSVVEVADAGSTPAQDAGGHVEAPDAHAATPDAAPVPVVPVVPDAGMPAAVYPVRCKTASAVYTCDADGGTGVFGTTVAWLLPSLDEVVCGDVGAEPCETGMWCGVGTVGSRIEGTCL